LLIAAVIFGCLGLSAQNDVSPNPRRSQSVANNSTPKQDSKNSDQNPPISNSVINTAKPENTSRKSPEITSESNQQPKEQVVTVKNLPILSISRDVLDYSGLILTVLLIGIAIWQIVLLKRTIRATEATVKIMKDTAERQLRAYVLPSRAQRVINQGATKAGVLSRVSVDLKNSGQTPAYDCVAFLGIGVFETGKATPLVLPQDMPVSQSVLAAGEKLELGGELRALTQEEEIRVAACVQEIHIYGKATYRDAFGIQRSTEFNLFCTGEWLSSGRFAACPNGTKAT
jgi:hypothetical protein